MMSFTLIRYGAPAVRDEEGADVQPPGILIPAGETWYYPQFNVYARFSDTGKYGYVQYMESPQAPIGDRPRNDRRVMASVYLPDLPVDLMDVVAPSTGAMVLPRPMAEADYDNFMDRVNGYYDLVDKMPAIYPFDYAGLHIPAFVSVQSFRGGDGVDRVDVNTEFLSTMEPLVGTSPFRRFVTTSTARSWPSDGSTLGTVISCCGWEMDGAAEAATRWRAASDGSPLERRIRRHAMRPRYAPSSG